MVKVETRVDAPIQAVYATVSDPTTYPEWLVGAQAIRGVERRWPAKGAKFFHRVGFGPLTIDDSTKVLEAREPTLVVLEARARPVGVATVIFRLRAEGDGTVVELEEGVTKGPTAALPGFLVDPPLRARNTESLRQLKAYVEERVRAGS